MRRSWVLALGLVLASCSKHAPTTDQPQSGAAQTLALGQANSVTAGETYRVGDVTVSVVRIAMASGEDDKGRDIHAIRMELRVTGGDGTTTALDLSADEPAAAKGLTFRADALGFEWGKRPATATLHVARQ
jgi:hypothetical protein